MPRPNFHQQVRKQKERARKARQEEKQQRRSGRNSAEPGTSGEGIPNESGVPGEALSETSS